MLILFLGIRADFIGSFCAGFARGTRDEIVTEFTDAEVSVSSGIKDTLRHCEPWSQHLTADGIKQMNQAISRSNVDLAKEAIDKGLTDTSAPWCIDLLKTAVVLVCTKCPKILKEALPTHYY